MYTIQRISKRLRIFLLICALLLILLVVVDLTGLGRDALSVSVPLKEDSDVARAEFLAQYGWEISTVPIEVQDVVIPAVFDKVYEQYNQLQQAQGFDLSSYKGKTVKRYTYRVINYPDETNQVRANLLVWNGRVIGGDLCTVALDGFMHGLDPDSMGITHQTFLEGIYG